MSFLRHPPSLVLTLFALTSLIFSAPVAAKLVNVTVDDSGTDSATGAPVIQYSPSTSWKDGSTCTDCTARPDPTRAFNGTWHDSTYDPSNSSLNRTTSAYFPFTGTAIYVYCIVAHTSSSPDGNMALQFYIDGDFVDEFQLQPDGRSTYDYNYVVYANASLPNGRHNFTLENGKVGGLKSLVMLDRIVYSQQDDSEPTTGTDTDSSASASTTAPSRPVSSAPIIGGAVGGLTIVLALTTLILFFLRRRRRQRHPKHLSVYDSGFGSAGFARLSTSQVTQTDFALADPFRIDPLIVETPSSPSHARAPSPRDIPIHALPCLPILSPIARPTARINSKTSSCCGGRGRRRARRAAARVRGYQCAKLEGMESERRRGSSRALTGDPKRVSELIRKWSFLVRYFVDAGMLRISFFYHL
ncbi:hypothetical protein EW146_g7324 [Bondarzewia mesenterica]|uniref:Malectin domain-containing protein n=1 Tax=Bondarzewia mesenterica TaxID=1095465 RepID=A0A4V3XEA1_9AGAM|nr:hypothetical protein EW146_g7324 [Bondarzewia mesenterica]